MENKNPKKIIFEELNVEELDAKMYSEIHVFDEEMEAYRETLIRTLMDLIGKEISKLPETQRDVLYGFYFAEKTLKQIGVELGLAENAVTLRKHRAVATLKKHLSTNPYAIKIYEQLKDEDPSLSILAKLAEELQLKKDKS